MPAIQIWALGTVAGINHFLVRSGKQWALYVGSDGQLTEVCRFRSREQAIGAFVEQEVDEQRAAMIRRLLVETRQ